MIFSIIPDPQIAGLVATFVAENWTQLAIASYEANKDAENPSAIVALVDFKKKQAPRSPLRHFGQESLSTCTSN